MRPRNLKLVSVLLAAGLVVGAYSGLSNAPVSGSTPAALVPALATAALPPAPMLPPLNLIPPPPVGSYPDFVFTPDTVGGSTMTIDLGLAVNGTWNVPNTTGQGIYDPVAWVVVYYFNDMVVPLGKTIKFHNHPSRAPVAFLAYNNIDVAGTIDVSGQDGWDGSSAFGGYAEPGPGGFRGGRGSPALHELQDSSAAFGPGGARITFNPSCSGWMNTQGTFGGFSTFGQSNHLSCGSCPGLLPGAIYGDVGLTQLIGGSGGGPANDNLYNIAAARGGAGGGALLCAANTHVIVQGSGKLASYGGYLTTMDSQYCPTWSGSGSGGAIRIVADHVELQPGAMVVATSRSTSQSPGRIRIEKNNLGDLSNSTIPPPSVDIGNAASAILFGGATAPRISVTSIGGAATPADPRAQIESAADVVLPQVGLTTVVLTGENVPTSWQVFLRVTRALGDATIVPVTVPPSGNNTLWTRTLQVDLSSGFSVLQAYANP